MPKLKRPDYYKAPLRKRSDIIAHIFDATHQRSDRDGYHPFCFNVKVYNTDMSYENLLKLWREYEGNHSYTRDSQWLAETRARYEEIGAEKIFDWGLEDARRHVEEDQHFLWRGDELTIKCSFQGRSGGWLSIDEFEGWLFGGRHGNDDGAAGTLEEMTYSTLYRFYQFIVQCQHDWSAQSVRQEVEHQAAFNFFANGCADIVEPRYIQQLIVNDDDIISRGWATT